MKKMKKISKTAVLLLTAILLTGCAEADQSNKSESDAAAFETQASAADENASEDASDSDLQGNEQDNVRTITDEELDKLLGSITDQTYKNVYFDFQYTLPNGASYSDEDALGKANSFDESISLPENAALCFRETGKPVLVMEARETGSAANDGVDTVSVEVIYAGEEITDEMIETIRSEAVSAIQTQYSQDSTMTVESAEYTIAGAARKGIGFAAEKSGIEVYERIIFVPKGQYLAEITLGTLDSSRLDSMMSCFTQ